MAKFLLTLWPPPTHLHPFLAVAHGLKARGHQVGVYSGSSARAVAEAEGLAFFPFRALDEAAVNAALRDVIDKNLGIRQWTRFLLGSIPQQLQDLEAILADWRPDAILCDMAMWGPILVLHEARGIPVAVLSHLATCILPGPEHRFPGMSWLLDDLQPTVRWAAAGLFKAAERRVRNEANRLRGLYGLSPLSGSVTQHTGTLPLYLVPGVPEFDGCRRDLPPSVHYVGPCLWEPPPGPNAPFWTDTAPVRPRILVTEGSIYREEPALLRAAAAALANRPFDVVLLAGYGRKPEDLKLGPLAPNLRLEAWTPPGQAMRNCGLVATNCDSETAFTALAAGLPLVAAPMILDQPEVACRVAANDAGVSLKKGRLSPARLLAGIQEVLRESRYREGARRLAARIGQCDGAARAAELLDAMLGSN